MQIVLLKCVYQPWNGDIDANGDAIGGIGIVHMELGLDIGRDEPDQFGHEHEYDEGHAAHGHDGARGGRLG